VQYGFAIDQRTCIGCHACTVACKTEHEIPVGQFRTWVKYVDKGEYPATTREFGVMRCNHCTDAPCIAICPTNALFKRDDGIVDFDNQQCIGCKSCMQACPYDALYIDEDTHTAAKCNFCAHRIDQGLEPACVVVCPTESIWVGDLDDAESGIRKFLSIEPVQTRTPEQKTGPNVFYVGASEAVLNPLAAPVDDTYIWANPDPQRAENRDDFAVDSVTRARTTLNTAHPRPWGWKVWSYLWTKSVAAGAVLVAAFLLVVDQAPTDLTAVVAPLLGAVFAAVTAVLLISDLKRPERFYYLLTKPNPTSWLVWGGVILGVFAAVVGLWFLGGVFGADALVEAMAWPAIPAAVLTAGYTAFLFGQAEGRDLWQSPVLFWHLQAQALMAGTGALLVAAPFLDASDGTVAALAITFTVATAAHLLMLLVELGGKHSTRNAEVAAHIIVRGRYAKTFWYGSVLLSLLVLAGGLAMSMGASAWLGVLVGLVVQVPLLAYESVFVKAAQDVPLS
jgi:Fe-S-cluster-containing dehydrogenase component/formate-dependent nitrite reductase membrane component NrfD